MIDIDIQGDELIVRLSGPDRWFSLRRRLAVPLGPITQVRVAPEMIKQRPVGMKLPGVFVPFWPGPLYEGTFVHRDGSRSFWTVRRPKPEQLLVVELNDDPGNRGYRRLVLQVPDATTTVRRIKQAIGLGQA